MNKFKPDGWPTVTPRIFTDDVARLVGFLKIVFGASGTLRSGAPTELRIGDSVVLISDGGGAREAMPAFLYVYVENADEAYQRALAAGAESIERPGTCLTATDEPRFGIRGGTSGRSRHTAGAKTIAQVQVKFDPSGSGYGQSLARDLLQPYLSALTRIRGSTMLSLLSLLTRSLCDNP